LSEYNKMVREKALKVSKKTVVPKETKKKTIEVKRGEEQ